MKRNNLAPNYITDLNIRNVNDAIINIYRHLNILYDSADEVSIEKTEKGDYQLVLNKDGKKYVDNSNTTRFGTKSKSDGTKLAAKIKTNLSLENVTNESKTTMFNNPQITGDVDGTESNPVVNTSVSNRVQLAPNSTTADFELRIIHPATGTYDNMITLFQGGAGKWAMGYISDSQTIFRINAGGDLNADVLQLTSAGNLTLDGTVTGTTITGANLIAKAANDAAASVLIQADNSDDAGDDWKIIANADQTLTICNDKALEGAFVPAITVTPHATATSTVTETAGSIKVGSNIIQASDGGSTITMDTSDNVTIGNNLACSEITAGAVIWQSFPFYVSLGTHSRYYYLDVDDTANSFRRWDDYDTTPTGINYRDIAGQFVVPEDCTLVAMHGVIMNGSSTNNPTVLIYHGSVTEAASDTTLASAGSVVVSITTLRVPYKFSKEDFDTDLSAGDIVVPMIKHDDTGGTRTFQGSLTLKFLTR